MEGTRKQKAFYWTMAAINAAFIGALVFGVKFVGGDIIALSALQASLAGAFFGANFGEHWAKAKKIERS